MIRRVATCRTPGIALMLLCLAFCAYAKAGGGVVTNAVRPTGKPYLISIGIDRYPTQKSSLAFANCTRDALSYDAFFKKQFKALDTARFSSTLLLNEQATKENILKAINQAMASKPGDYLIFNFSGFTDVVTDSTGKKTTYFVPYGMKNIEDKNEIREKGIALSQLSDLLQLVPANNQLFITEAGYSEEFQREFIKSLIENNPDMAALSNKNRVFILPKLFGKDSHQCKGERIEHGPLAYYLTTLTRELNIYGLFASNKYFNQIRYALAKAEVECSNNSVDVTYFDIYSERTLLTDLQYYMPTQVMQMRGTKAVSETLRKLELGQSKRYALVIGTNTYASAAQWPKLNNPVPDAQAVANELEQKYGYAVIRLFDGRLDSIYHHILGLSRVLKETDQLLIFIAGHGDFDGNLLDDGFIVARDSKTSAEDPFRNSYIQYSKLSRMINKLPPRQILLLMDVCFGGTFDERVARNVARSGNSLYDDMSADAYIGSKLEKKTRIYITSGGKKEVPDGYAGRHSPFAQRLIIALQGMGGATRMLTANNLYQFVEKLPSGPLIGSFGDDEPGSEYLLLPLRPETQPLNVKKE